MAEITPTQEQRLDELTTRHASEYVRSLQSFQSDEFIIITRKDLEIPPLLCNPVTEEEAEAEEFHISTEELQSSVAAAEKANALCSLKAFLNQCYPEHPFTKHVNGQKIFPAVRFVLLNSVKLPMSYTIVNRPFLK